MKSRRLIIENKGFTIVELLIASAVFSVALIIAAFTITEIGKLYYKGINVSRTQDSARVLLENVSRPIQLSSSQVAKSSGPPTTPGSKAFCVGNIRFTYIEGMQSGYSGGFDASTRRVRYALWQDDLNSPAQCLSATLPNLSAVNPNNGTSGSNGKSILAERMWLQEFAVEPSAIDNSLWNITVSILYGDRDLMNPDDPGGTTAPVDCKGSVAGSQWCAHVKYETTVLKRIKNSDNS